MGGSFASYLRCGMAKDTEARLRAVVETLRAVVSEIYDDIGSDGQYDNAADEGALAERLSIAASLVEDTLPAVPKAVPHA